jgi:RimJ/RimL family protein N-acetyltransferase
MLRSEHGYIRMTEEDDAVFFHALYAARTPRFALLDLKRESVMPTLFEISETLASKEAAKSLFFTLEHPDGRVAGFMVLRGLIQESGYCELAPMMLEVEDLHTPLADWALGLMLERAFGVLRLRKVMAHALSTETRLIAFFERHGFQHDGAQREAVFAQGRWADVLFFSLAAQDAAQPPAVEHATCP